MKYGHWLWLGGLSVILTGVNALALAPDKDARSQSLPMQSGISRSAVGVNYRTLSNGRPAVYVHQSAGAAYVPTMDQERTIKAVEQSGVTVERHSRLGLPVSVRGTDLGQRKTYSGGQGLNVSNGGQSGMDAVAVVDNLSGVFGIRNAQNEFAAKPVERDGLGYSHTRLDQRYNGLRVVGGQLITHFNNRGQAYEVNGRYIPGIEVLATPRIDGATTIELAQTDLIARGNPAGEAFTEPELVIFALENEPRLAYELALIYQDEQTGVGLWRYWVDAGDGSIILGYNDVKMASATITGKILSREGGGSVNVEGTYDASYYMLFNQDFNNGCWYWSINNYNSNSISRRLTSDWNDSDRAEMSAAYNIDMAQEYFRIVHGRPGAQGAPVSSSNPYGNYLYAKVHVYNNWVNAAWIGGGYNQIWIGDGDGIRAAPLAVLDVCGHEFAHGVTEHSADLYYYGESGALNESFSDIFGACVEFYAQPDGRALYPSKAAGHSDWLVGEDCWLSSTALRDMRNPSSTVTLGSGSQQPSRYKGSYWYNGGGDNGGVHYNGGPQSFFFYLLAEGGSGNNDGLNYNVTGIGITNAAAVAYRALTVYCWEFTDYAEAGGAWRSAANDLNPAWVSNIDAAWNAVYAPVTNNYAPWYTGGCIYSSPAIADDGTIYIGSYDGLLYAFNSSGVAQRTWKMAKGTMSSPAIAPDGKIYIGAEDGRFYSFNPDGTTNHIWTTDRSIRQMADFDAVPAFGPDGTIYIGASDHVAYYSEPSGTFYAFNPNGTTNHVWTVAGAIASSAAIGPDGVIYVGDQLSNGDGHLYAFNPNGTTKWVLNLGAWVTDAIIGGDGTIYVGAWNNRLYAVSPNGSITHSWTLDSFPYFSSPVIGPDDSIYITTYLGTLYSFSPDGHTNHTWGPVPNGFWGSTPAIGSDGSIYVGEHVNRLWVFNANGTTNRTYTTDSPRIFSSPTISPDGTVYIGGLDNKLYALAGTGGGLANSVWPKRSKNLRNTGIEMGGGNSSGTLQFSVSAYSVNENAGSATLTVTRAGGSSGAASVNYATTNGTASAGTDYTAVSGTLNWTDGNASSKTITIPIINRSGTQGNRSFTVIISSASSASMGAPYSATVTISDAGGGGQAPSTPTGVTASDETYMDKVRVTWTASSGALYYHVYRNTANDSGTAQVLGFDSPDTTCDDTTATAGTTYYYWVKAGNMSGESGFSNPDTGYRAAPQTPPSAPTAVSASDGTYTDKVRVSWSAVADATSYEVWRNTANNSASALKQSDTGSPVYDDTSATAGVTYYYWVKAKNASGTSGFSASDSGYRASGGDAQTPSSPGAVLASDGTYVDKVLVYWEPASSATSYKVWRSADNNVQNASMVGTCMASVYLDTTATAGVIYYYWIQAINAAGESAFSASDSGYCGSISSDLTSPMDVKASDGTYTNRILVSWQAVNNASGYEVWRNTETNRSSATMIGNATTTSYNDLSVAQGIYYYYWIRANNLKGYGGFGDTDTGWCRLSPPAGLNASDVSYPYHIMVSWNPVANAAWYEVWREEVPGENSNGGNLMKVAQAGETYFNDYYTRSGVYYRYKVKVCNGLCSSDFNYDTGVRQVNTTSTSLPVLNDYDGDKLSDLALFNSSSGVLDVLCSALGRQTFSFGAEINNGLSGDLDGDGLDDPVAYCADSGTWLVRLSSIGYTPVIQARFGGQGNTVATADYDGDGLADLTTYNETDGILSVMLSNGGTYDRNASCSLGGPGYLPVSADFDGDGLADPAVYSESEGQLIALLSGNGYSGINIKIGGAGQTMLAADFDGDSKADPVLYERAPALSLSKGAGTWTVLLSSIEYCVAKILFGGPGYVPAIGDFDGDGLADPAIYRESDGQWLIMLSGSGYSVIDETFGAVGLKPVGK